MLRKKLITISVLASALVLVLFGSVNAAVEKGPYLIYDGVNTEMSVLWQLNNSESCTITWGLDTSYLMGNANTLEYGSDHQHMHTITGLTPATKYYYKVVDESGDIVGSGSFFSAPQNDASSVKFMVYGDTRTYPTDHDGVNARMITTYTNDPGYQTLTLHVGDWVGNGDSEDDWAYQFFDPIYSYTHQFQANIPIIGCKGNHEGSGMLFYKYFPYLYTNDFYWSFDYGPAHIAIIDQYVDYSPGSEQYVWLENDLAYSNKKWKFLIFHEPGWSAGGHSNSTNVQNYIQPLCETYGVDIIFAGHNHYYARCAVDGIQHITTGGGGAPLYSPNPNYENVIAVAESYHFCEVDIQENQLHFSARDKNGYVIDEFSIVHSTDELAVDFDGDHKADVAIYRAGGWFILPSSVPGTYIHDGFGAANDVPVPGDYDGDGKTDVAVFRPSNNYWYITPSSGGSAYAFGFGAANDVPVPGDYDGDGKTDVGIYRPGTGVWLIIPSSGGPTIVTGWGGQPNDVPVPGDYDGDGKTDCAVYRAGGWFILPSSVPGTYIHDGFGAANDVPVPGDYDGDGKTDVAVFRPSNNYWYITPSSGGSAYAFGFGAANDVPVPGDYDGDGKTDVGIYRPGTGVWLIIPSSGGPTIVAGWGGQPNDVPVNPTAVIFLTYM